MKHDKDDFEDEEEYIQELTSVISILKFPNENRKERDISILYKFFFKFKEPLQDDGYYNHHLS